MNNNDNMNTQEMSTQELINKKFVERSMMKTPSGGDYSEAHFFDENWNYTTKDKAMYMVVKEFNVMGKVINELVMSKSVNTSVRK